MVVIPAEAPNPGVQRNGPIGALLIDRQPLFLAALGSLLAAPPLSARVMTAPRSDSVMELVQTGEIDIVCCELHSDPAPGVELARILSQERPNVPIILLGELGDEPELAAALSTSVAGLFTKSAGLDEFLAGVRAVLSGHRAIGSGVIGELLQHLNSPTPMDVRRFGNHLSPTELEILAMIGQAQSIPSIAASRGISHKTVRNHLAKIYRKLDLHGRTEAMLWAARMGLTSS